MSWRQTLSRWLMTTACLLLLAILAFIGVVGPRTGWSKDAKTDTGKSYTVISAEAPAAVHFAFIGVKFAFPICILGYVLVRPR
jgi:hypothetical protein